MLITPEMSNVAEVSEPPLEGLGKLEPLAQHLRSRPFLVPDDTDSLAEEFGLEPDFVEDVARALSRPVRKRSSFEEVLTAVRKSVYEAVSQGCGSAGRTFLRSTEKPLLFVVITGLIGIGMAYALGRQVDNFQTGPSGFDIALLALTSAVLILILLTHLACYARHGRVRVPIYGAVACLVCLTSVVAILMISTGALRELNFVLVFIFAGIASTVITIIYGGLGVAAALAGGLYKIRRASRLDVRKSRQELLERLFEVENRLRSHGAIVRPKARGKVGLLTRLRKSPNFFWVCLGLGFVAGLLEVAVVGTMARSGIVAENSQSIPLAVATLITFVISTALYCVMGYAGGRVGRSVLAVSVGYLGSLVASLIPWGIYGPQMVGTMLTSWSWVVPLCSVVFVGLLTGVGAFIEQQTHEDRRMQNDDPAMLLAEMVRIQWRLNPMTQATCIFVVDVARSTAMKADADPLKVEWSFREYQRLVESVSASHGGEVLSTAGDGGVVAFSTCNEALQAAKELQTEMHHFNSRVNRLQDPFRLRIGLHTGQTTAQIAEVQFNELIDIAAHVESHAPVGGIAITEPVARLLPDEPVAALKQEVDGQAVSIVLNPTIGA